MLVLPFLSTGFLSNIFLLFNEKDALIIDPGSPDPDLIKEVEERKLVVRGYLITHDHKEHTMGLNTLLKIYPSPIYSYKDEIEHNKTIQINDNDFLDFNGFKIRTIHIPGHSNDAICYKVDNLVFTGDTIFASKIAQTTSYQKKALLIKGIKDKIFTLDNKTFIFPGHGPLTQVEIEKKFNINI